MLSNQQKIITISEIYKYLYQSLKVEEIIKMEIQTLDNLDFRNRLKLLNYILETLTEIKIFLKSFVENDTENFSIYRRILIKKYYFKHKINYPNLNSLISALKKILYSTRQINIFDKENKDKILKQIDILTNGIIDIEKKSLKVKDEVCLIETDIKELQNSQKNFFSYQRKKIEKCISTNIFDIEDPSIYSDLYLENDIFDNAINIIVNKNFRLLTTVYLVANEDNYKNILTSFIKGIFYDINEIVLKKGLILNYTDKTLKEIKEILLKNLEKKVQKKLIYKDTNKKRKKRFEKQNTSIQTIQSFIDDIFIENSIEKRDDLEKELFLNLYLVSLQSSFLSKCKIDDDNSIQYKSFTENNLK